MTEYKRGPMGHILKREDGGRWQICQRCTKAVLQQKKHDHRGQPSQNVRQPDDDDDDDSDGVGADYLGDDDSPGVFDALKKVFVPAADAAKKLSDDTNASIKSTVTKAKEDQVMGYVAIGVIIWLILKR